MRLGLFGLFASTGPSGGGIPDNPVVLEQRLTFATQPCKSKKRGFWGVVIATFLDPRRKLGYLKLFYKKVWNDANKVDKVAKVDQDITTYEERCESTSCVVLMPVANKVSNNAESPCLAKRKIEEEFAEYMNQKTFEKDYKSEIDAYLEENIEKRSDNWDILAWWQCKSDKYPVFSTMVLDFLAIPLSIVSSESTFSYVLGDRRSSLSPQILKALICVKDCLSITSDLDVE
ncbi:LOW QUALITY PROTEIN: hypothetical protein U9M48_006728, partial [Paspalum notatum var. saurae]